MALRGPPPKPPAWALSAGLPAPYKRETFRHYTERLGLDCDELLSELTERTMPLANSRLASRIAKDMPAAFSYYLETRYKAAHGAI